VLSCQLPLLPQRDHQRRIVVVNDVHLALVGHRREELLLRPLDDLELGRWAMTQKRSQLTTPHCVRCGGARSALIAKSPCPSSIPRM
jgi:hypothetical protein